MVNAFRKTFCLLLLILAAPSIGYSVNLEKDVSESKAIELAEEFVRNNGYTTEAGNIGLLSLESLDLETDTSALLKGRRNTLQSKDYGVSRLVRSRGGQKWAIIFRYVSSSGDIGRAVVMDPDGSNINIADQNFLLESVGKVLVDK